MAQGNVPLAKAEEALAQLGVSQGDLTLSELELDNGAQASANVLAIYGPQLARWLPLVALGVWTFSVTAPRAVVLYFAWAKMRELEETAAAEKRSLESAAKEAEKKANAANGTTTHTNRITAGGAS